MTMAAKMGEKIGQLVDLEKMIKKQGQLANDATSSVYDYYLRHLSVSWLINHFSTFLIGWSRDS